MASTNTAPILNDYKIEFAKRRCAQVVLGGIIIFFNDDQTTVPFYAYLLQFVVAILPVVIGLTLELVQQNLDAFSHDWIPALIFAGMCILSSLFSFSLQYDFFFFFSSFLFFLLVFLYHSA